MQNTFPTYFKKTIGTSTVLNEDSETTCLCLYQLLLKDTIFFKNHPKYYLQMFHFNNIYRIRSNSRPMIAI